MLSIIKGKHFLRLIFGNARKEEKSWYEKLCCGQHYLYISAPSSILQFSKNDTAVWYGWLLAKSAWVVEYLNIYISIYLCTQLSLTKANYES